MVEPVDWKDAISVGSTLGPGGGGHRPPKSWLASQIQPAPKLWIGPKFSGTRDTLWSIDYKK